MRIEITGKCNLKCLYCHAARLNNPIAIGSELKTERILSLIDEAKKLGCSEFTLIGGEPFLNQDWPEIVKRCGEDSIVNITTNGHFFDEFVLAKICEFPQIQEFRISLDGLLSHDKIRVGSSHKKILATVAKMTSFFPERRIVVQTTCNRQNLPEILDLYDELKKTSIFRWYIGHLWCFGSRAKENEDFLEFSDYAYMFSIYKKLIQKFQADGRPFWLAIHNVYNSQIAAENAEEYVNMDFETHPCLYYFRSICIKASGELTFCPALDLPFASIYSQPLHKALKSPWLRDFKLLTIRSLPCGNCRYIKLCGGGCRADAFACTGGDINGLDSNSCCFMAHIEKDIVPILSINEQEKYHKLINDNGDMPSFYKNDSDKIKLG